MLKLFWDFKMAALWILTQTNNATQCDSMRLNATQCNYNGTQCDSMLVKATQCDLMWLKVTWTFLGLYWGSTIGVCVCLW